VVEIRDAVET